MDISALHIGQLFKLRVLSFLTGRILNRFSKDMGFVDDMMPFTYCDFLQVSLVSTPLHTVGLSQIVIFFLFDLQRRGHSAAY